MAERPTTINCAFCGVEVPVKPAGQIPRWCPDHRDPKVRETEEGGFDPVDRVCRWESCQIPLADDWPNEFCPNHWRLLSLETRGELITHTNGTDEYERGVLSA